MIEAADGKEAVERFLLHKDQIQLVLCDVIMPGRSGAEIEKAIRAEAPDMPILFMSGYAGDIVYRKSLIDRDVRHHFQALLARAAFKKNARNAEWQ